jgi:hypothetical protein
MMKPQHLSYLPHGQLSSGRHPLLPIDDREGWMPELLTRQGKANSLAGVAGFIPESWPASSRKTGRLASESALNHGTLLGTRGHQRTPEDGGGMSEQYRIVTINRAPVLTLWASVVAERLGLERAEALTLGRALSGLTAHAKGVRLGIFEPAPDRVAEQKSQLQHGDEVHVRLMGRTIPAVHTAEGLRALSQGKPIAPASVERYLKSKFGEALSAVRSAMETLAGSLPPEELAKRAFGLYEEFQPPVTAGTAGWGAEGELNLDRMEALAQSS